MLLERRSGIYKPRERDLHSGCAKLVPVYFATTGNSVCARRTNIYEGLSGLMTANLRKVTKSFLILPFIVLYTKHQNDISHQEKRKALAKGKIKRCVTVN